VEGSELRPRQGLYHYYDVGPGFFEVMGIPIVAGRGFGPDDGPGSPAVGIVTAVGAEAWWPGEDPVGRRLKLGRDAEWITIVGVTPDLGYLHPEGRGFSAQFATGGSRPLPLLFRPAAQRGPTPSGWIEDGAIIGNDGAVLAVRAAGATGPVEELLAAETAALAPDLPMKRVDTLADWERDGNTGALVRLYRALVTSVAGAGLLVALLGVSGAISDAVLRRTRETGIRKALGARPSQVTLALAGETMTAVALGAAIGLLPLFALHRLLGSEPAYGWWLLGASLVDWRVLASVVAAVLMIAAASCALWTRHARRLEPATALRVD
jgi:putative ABC transport system permease protein